MQMVLRVATLWCAALLLGGCGVLTQWIEQHRVERTPVPEERSAAVAEFFWPYAALAANVYQTGGTVDRDVLIVASSAWLRQEIAKSRDPHVIDKFNRAGGILDVKLSLERQVTNCSENLSTVKNDGDVAAKAEAARCEAVVREAGREARAEVQFQDGVPQTYDDCKPGKEQRSVVPLSVARQPPYGWQPVIELQRQIHPRGWSVFVPGLAIDIWRRERGAGVMEYAVVYRGTAGTGGWLSNFRAVSAFTPFVWDQYLQATEATRDIITQIYRLHAIGDDILARPQRTQIRITAVGHSLGGGLANYVLLRLPQITRVVNFDPSPVDGSSLFSVSDLSAPAKEWGHRERRTVFENRVPPFDSDPLLPGAAIYTLYEEGEIVTAIFGCPSGAIWGEEGGPVRQCYSVNLAHGSALKQHNMDQLACNLYVLSRNLKGSTASR